MLTDNDRRSARQKKEDVRICALEGLKQTLGADIPGHECEWAERVRDALNRVEEALRSSWGSGRTSEGPLASVDKTRPTLAREAEVLHGDHDRLVEETRRLSEDVRKMGAAFQPEAEFKVRNANMPVPDFGAMRLRIEQFLTELGKNLEAEDVLVLDSANTDIGVGD
jgi:hypothetical protein